MSTVLGWQASDAELLAELRAVESRLHATWAQMLSVVAEVDSRGTAGAVGYGTTVELVRAVARFRGVRRGPGCRPQLTCYRGGGWVVRRWSRGYRLRRWRWLSMRSGLRTLR
ncbi:MAG: hypothetical protein ACRDS1_01470 [Pseudonocardiaceae bacterium]